MDLRAPLRTGLTICTLVGALMMAKPTEAVMGTDTEIDCESRRHPLYHTVEGNQNLWDISRLYFGMIAERDNAGKIAVHYPTEIATANHIKTFDPIHAGQRLRIPGRYRGNDCL